MTGGARLSSDWPPPLDLARDALFLDVDGTLLDIAPRPDAVVVPQGLPASLARLAGHLGGALGLLTGRDIATVDRLFPRAGLAVAGLHGAEIRLPDGSLRQTPPPLEIDTARTALRAFVAARPGLLLEDKGAAIAVHFRGAPAYEAEVEAEVRRLIAAAGAALTLQIGKMVAEIRPVGSDKGMALQALLALPPFLGRRPVVAGDDWTDEAAFAVANRLGGRSLRIGPADRPTAATEAMASPEALRAWLAAQAG